MTKPNPDHRNLPATKPTIPATPRILICRAEPGASRTAARLEESGYVAVVEPVLTLQPLPIARLDIPPGSHIAITSPNAADRLSELLCHRQAKLYVTGNTTAKHARQAGFKDVKTAHGNLNDLVSTITTHLPAGTTVHHPANRAAGHRLAEKLDRYQITVRVLHTYHTAPVQNPAPTLKSALTATDPKNALAAILIHSANGAKALRQLLPKRYCLPAPIVAISQQAANPLNSIAPDTLIAKSPDDNAMITALGSLPLPRTPTTA